MRSVCRPMQTRPGLQNFCMWICNKFYTIYTESPESPFFHINVTELSKYIELGWTIQYYHRKSFISQMFVFIRPLVKYMMVLHRHGEEIQATQASRE